VIPAVEGTGPCQHPTVPSGEPVDDPQLSHNGLWRREAMYVKGSRPLSTIHNAYYYDYRFLFI
jgi:hypothetical protein